MQPGDIVAARYAIRRPAATGGMATVYEAADLHEDRVVAVKLLRESGGDRFERFAREARILSSLRHPGIVRYLAHGAADHAESFLVMEWLEGEDLRSRLARGPLSVGETLRLARQVADALGHAHAHGIIHRDVKPGNLFLPDGDVDRVKLLDFGVAKLLPAEDTHTGRGGPIGTAGYMAPEQVVASADLDARADVFSLGCVIFACLTGRSPFFARQREALLAKTLLDEPARVTDIDPSVPAALADLVERMLAKDRDERPRDGAELVRDLAALDDAAPAAVAPPRPALTARERRHVCVILVAADAGTDSATDDGSTTRTRDSREPSSDRLRAFGARIESLADGTLLAVLAGAAVATDRAFNAARCALGLHAMRRSAPIAMASGWGVITGALPVGEVIDRAAELLRREASEAGAAIRIDELSAALLDRRFVVRRDERGIFLEGELPAGAVTPRIGWRSPFVGRERELASLTAMVERSFAEPSPCVALVTGPPGAGKSRVCEELLEQRSAAGAPFQVWAARGDALAAGSALRLLGVALRATAGIRDDDPASTQRRKLASRVARQLPASQAARVAWFLGELAGVPFPDEDDVQGRAARRDPLLMNDQMRAAWLDFLAAESAATPVILYFDDLQWGDAASLQLVDAALRRVGDHAWMVLGAARPDVHAAFPRLWTEHGLQEVRLGELAPRAAERLVAETLGDRVDHAHASRLVEQAGGNPFFLEELIRAVASGRGAWSPATVLAMVEGRLDALAPGARRVLRAASVLGRGFSRGGLTALLGEHVQGYAVNEWLGELVDAELIAPRGEARHDGDVEYLFRHELVREAAYTRLTDDDRRLGHRLALGWLEHAGERDALLLAEHAERGGEPARAATWLGIAADQALEAHDLVAAIARAQRAVSLGPPALARGMMYVVLAEAHRWRGQNLRAERHALAALRRLDPASVDWYRAAAIVALASARVGHVRTLLWLADRLAGVWGTGPSDLAVVASALLAEELLHAGEYDRADAILTRIEPLAADLAPSDPLVAARVHEAQTIQALFRGELETALRHCHAAVVDFERAGDVRNACLRRVSAAFLTMEAGAYERAEALLRETATAALALGLEPVAAVAWQNLGLVLARLGRFAEATATEARAIASLAAQGHRRMEGLSRQYLAIILASAGDAAAAEPEARRAAELLAVAPSGRAYALATHGQILLALGRTAEARAAASAAANLLASLGRIEEGEALIRLVDAETLEAIGALDEARAALDRAAARLLARGAAFEDPDLRASFLERVPENARTLSAASRSR